MRFRAASFILLGVLILTGLRVFLVRADCTSGGSDPGKIVVVGEIPVVMQFSLASGIPYKFNYPANIALWTSPLRTTAVPSGTAFTSGSGAVFGDANGDSQVRLDDLIFIRNRIGTNNAACDLDASGTVDQNDLVLCRNAMGSGPGTLTVYAEGLGASNSLCDTPVQLLTDPDHDNVFDSAATTGLTVLSVSVAPLSGSLGTPITVTIQPALSPLAFDTTTSARWIGVYQPSVGPATDAFEIDYSSPEVHESSTSTASLFIGEGTATDAPAAAGLAGTGTLNGSLTLVFSRASVRRTFSFTMQPRGVTWERIAYSLDELEWVYGPPSLDGEPPHVQVLEWSSTGQTNPPTQDTLLYLRELHHAAVIRIPETAEATATAPAFLLVDVVSLDAAQNELDRRTGVRLDKIPDDGDPNNIVYSSHLSKPIVLIDTPVVTTDYPNVTVLHAVENGYLVAVPNGH